VATYHTLKKDQGTTWRYVSYLTFRPLYPGEIAFYTYWIREEMSPRAGLKVKVKVKLSLYFN